MAEPVNTEIGIAGEEPSGGLPQMDTETFASQLIWLALTFAFLYLMMSKVALPRIATVLEERRDRIADDLDKAAELKAQTDAAIKAYEAALAEARSKANAIAQETRDAVNADIEKQRQKTDAELDERMKKAEAQIAKTKAQAVAGIRALAGEAAGMIVDRLIGEKVDASAVEKTVDAELASAGKN
jgi:F-type H+-transporting ATPase subunit b